MANKYTPKERREQQQNASRAGLAGALGGSAVGYKGYKGAVRAGEGAKAGKEMAVAYRQLGGGRLKAAGAAARVAPAAFKAPKKKATMGALAAGYVGYMGGLVGGAEAGQKLTQKKHDQKRIGKSMSTSAFGIDHGEISKAQQKKASAGRIATGAAFGPYHGLVAGKEGSKLKTAGTQFAGGMVGGIAGSAVSRFGSIPGSIAGNAAATAHAHKKGWLKPQKRK